MAGFTIEYLINLRDSFSAAAERVMKSANEARSAIGNMGKASADLDKQLTRSAEALSRVSGSAEKAAQGVGAFTKANSRAAQESARFAELQIKSMNRIEKMEQGMYERHVARQNLIKSGAIPGPKERGSGVGFMGGLFALSMLHNDVTKDWANFDDEMRKMRGTMAGQLSDADIAALRESALDTARGTIFSGTDIAKIMMAEAERGVPLNERTKSGELLGGVIAKQMLGIATATGEDPAKTFETHLAIARGFEMPFSDFPHISDTIARIHQKTGISLKQIETQMGQIAAYAHSAGWTEEQTIGTVGFLAKRGMGQYAGSGLARIISKSLNWSKPAAEAWKALGIKKDDIIDPKTGGMLNPADLVKLISDHTKNMTPAEVAAHLNKMFGDRGQKVAAAFANAIKSSDPDELRKMIEDLTNVDGLAEKMGVEGSKGGVAGLKKFAAAWENLKLQIGDSGFGEHVGWLASKFGEMFDTISGGPGFGKEAVGWTAAALNGLSAAALPIIALGTLGSGLASTAKWLGTIAGFGEAGTALWSVAGALKAIGLGTGVGLALGIGYAVVTNWKEIAAAAEKLAAALGKIVGGNKQGIEDAAKVLGDANETLGKKAAEPKTMGPFTNPFHSLAYGIPEQDMWINLPKKFTEWFGFIGDSPPPGATFNPNAPHFNPRGAPSAADAAANAQKAAAQRVQADVNVRTSLDPIQIHAPTLQVQVTGTVNAPNGITGSGSVPLSATAPRGRTMAEPAAPRVKD